MIKTLFLYLLHISWGATSQGRLGIGPLDSDCPAILPPHTLSDMSNVRIHDIAAGYAHSVVITEVSSFLLLPFFLVSQHKCSNSDSNENRHSPLLFDYTLK